MLNQREMDIALVEAKVEVQALLQEWVEEYLGSRLDGDNRGSGAGSAGTAEGKGAYGQATEDADAEIQGGQAY